MMMDSRLQLSLGIRVMGVVVLSALVAVIGVFDTNLSEAQSAPATPGPITITRADGTLTASWDAVSGASKYHITYTGDHKSSWQGPDCGANCTSNSITIAVDNAKTYYVAVRAGNDNGWSGWRNSSAASPFVPPTPEPIQPPATPGSITITRSDGTLTATWSTIADAETFHVTYTDNGAQSWQLAALDHPADDDGDGNESITFDVDNDKTYIVGVRAKNSAGGSNWRNSASAGPYLAPGIIVQDSNGNAITALSVPEGGEASYEVKLTAPPTEDTKVCIGLSVRDNNDSDIKFKGESGDLVSVNLTFTPSNWNIAQTVTLVAAEDDDSSNGVRDVGHDTRDYWWYWGGEVNLTVTEIDNDPSDPPARPTGLTASAANQSVTLDWDDPADSSITGYEYQTRYAGVAWSAWTAMASSDSDTTSFSVTGLVNGTEYRFKIRAVNTAGNSRPAPASSPWFVSATPTAPVTLTADDVTATSATITLGNWDGAWHYSTSAASGGASGAGAASGGTNCNGPVNGQQTTVGGLDPNTSYTINVYGNGCGGAAIASGQLVTPTNTVSLTASNITYYGATITLTGHTGDWWYQQTTPSSSDCTKIVSPGTTESFTGFEPGVSYTYKAYSDATCTTELTSDATDADFTTSSVALSTPWHIVPEGSSETHTVWLGRRPSANVTVTVATSGDSDITANPTTLTFTPSNWSHPQTVTLTAAQDTDTVPGTGKGDGSYAYGATTVTHTATSTDANFNNVSSVLDATEGDDDVCSGTTAVGGSGVTSGAIVEDCDTLLASKDIINGSKTTVNDWSTTKAMGSWTGVTVANSRVTELKMEMFLYAATDGNTPNTIADLDALTHLEMQSGTRAARPGPMPRGIAGLTGLTTLELYHRELTGQLPANIGDLTGLTSLVLDDNQLSGPLPASLGDLGNLTTLWLELNRFTGRIPAQLGNLTSLNLTLDENLLTGCVPPGWSGYLSKINPQHDASGNDVNLPLCVGPPTKPTTTPKNNDIEMSWTTPIGTPNWYQIQWRPCQVTPRADDGKWKCEWRTAVGKPWQPAWASWDPPIIGMDGKRGGQAVVNSSPQVIGETTNRASWSGDVWAGAAYQVRVRAHDIFGYGPWSEPSDIAWSSTPPSAGVSLNVSFVAGTTATLGIINHSGNWYYKADTGPDTTCQGPVSTTTEALTGLTPGTTYTYKAYSDATCTTGNLLATASAFTTPATLTASGITTTAATLTIDGHSAAWYYQSDVGPDSASCQGPVAANDSTEDLTGLTAGTWYTYKAYSDSSCSTANELAAEAFSSAVTVSNLSESNSPNSHTIGGTVQWAQEFTTGSNGGGYTLSDVTLNFDSVQNASGITVYLRSRLSNGKPDTTTALATLSGTPAVGDRIFTCSGAGCALDAGKQYFIHIAGVGQTTNGAVNTTTSDAETGASGWSIADSVRYSANNWNEISAGRSLKLRVTAVPKPSLSASSVTATTATLTVTGQTGDWWLKKTAPTPAGSCTAGESDYSHALSSLTTVTTYTYKAYSDSACTTEIASVDFTTP